MGDARADSEQIKFRIEDLLRVIPNNMKSFLIRDILSGSGITDSREAEHVHEHEHEQRGGGGGGATSKSVSSSSSSSSSGNNNNNNNNNINIDMKPQFQMNSPLDALFQMTSSTIDTLKNSDRRKELPKDSASGVNLIGKQSAKKKRKSRTAFTNSQIYELERRFTIQKYLSPTDRDEIAMTLNLSNAQVITWFQNRRAKMKRDLEEKRRDIETANLLNLHKIFLESFQALSQMKPAPGQET